MITICGQWRWRDDELSMPEFRKLSQQDKEEYLDLIKGLDSAQRSSMDEYLVNLYNLDKPQNVKKLLEL